MNNNNRSLVPATHTIAHNKNIMIVALVDINKKKNIIGLGYSNNKKNLIIISLAN